MANNRNSHNHYVFRDRVCHNYHDCSNEPDPEPASLGENNGLSGACNVEAHFPVKLHYMLSQVESDGTSHIVSWQVCLVQLEISAAAIFFVCFLK